MDVAESICLLIDRVDLSLWLKVWFFFPIHIFEVLKGLLWFPVVSQVCMWMMLNRLLIWCFWLFESFWWPLVGLNAGLCFQNSFFWISSVFSWFCGVYSVRKWFDVFYRANRSIAVFQVRSLLLILFVFILFYNV